MECGAGENEWGGSIESMKSSRENSIRFREKDGNKNVSQEDTSHNSWAFKI